MSLRFHWRLPQGGEGSGTTRLGRQVLSRTALPDIDAQSEFCREAEELGIDSVLVDISEATPDPVALSTALALGTRRVRFLIAQRSGLISPTLLVQQINTLSSFCGGRVSLNIVAGHSPAEQRRYGDHLPHDERYARTEEFLRICHALWDRNGPVDFEGRHFRVEGAKLNTHFVSGERDRPEIFIGGGSDAARDLALSCGHCWVQFAAAPGQVGRKIADFVARGKDAGLRLSVVGARTRAQALRKARALLRDHSPEPAGAVEKDFVAKSDSQSMRAAFRQAEEEWLTPSLWTGLVRVFGAPALALVGSPEEIAEGFREFKKAGVSQFILAGWPKREEMRFFGREVLPLIRRMERDQAVEVST